MRTLIRNTLFAIGMVVIGALSISVTADAKKKSYKVTPKSTPCIASYKKEKNYSEKTRQYFTLKSYLEKMEKGGGTLIVKKGTYKITGPLYVPSNVTIKLSNGTVLKKAFKSKKYLFQLVSSKRLKKDKNEDYKASRNVTINGSGKAIINLCKMKGSVAIGMAHNYNVKVNNVRFTGRKGGTYVAIAGCKKVSIKSCRFTKGTDVNEPEDLYDIHMETPNKAIDEFGLKWSKKDNTINRSISIEKNLFDGSLGAIGTLKHGAYSSGKTIYQNTISIENNKFKNMGLFAIRSSGWKNVSIKSNRFYRTDKKITPVAVLLKGVTNPTISSNVFRYVGYSIQLGESVNLGSGSEYKSVGNSVTEANRTAMKNNTVAYSTHYYVYCDSSLSKQNRLFYFKTKAENNFTITPSSSTYREKYTNYTTYCSNTKHYFLLQSYMDQLSYCGGGTLTLKAGTYNLSNAVYIPSNVTLNLENGVSINKVTAKYVESIGVAKALFILVPLSKANVTKSVKGYGGTRNVTIAGKGNATINCKYLSGVIGVVLGHCQNITLKGVNFRNELGAHFMELNSSSGVTIDGCTFEGFKPQNRASDGVLMTWKECINVDGTDTATSGFNYEWSAHDKTTAKNIIVRNCTFNNVGSGIGSHTYSANGKTQLYHQNIQIYNNTFSNTLNSGVRALNWKKVVIRNNTFSSAGASNKLYAAFLRGMVDVSVKNNVFSKCYGPIRIDKVETSKPVSAKYPDTISSLTAQNFVDLKNNTVKRGSVFTLNDIYLNGYEETDVPANYYNSEGLLVFQ